MKPKFQELYKNIAREVSKMSHARRRQVGAVIVKDDRVISMGYNGMPAGWENNCEDKDFMSSDARGWLNPDEIEERWPFIETSDEDDAYIGRYRLVTKPEVLHAESNALAKLARSTESGLGSDLFVTTAPCLDCAKLIFQSGISRVWYSDAYREDSGIRFLKASGVEVIKHEE
jgi:dCMP deaminase